MRYFALILLITSSVLQAATPPNWAQAALSVCQQLQTAAQAYQKQDIQTAHVTAVMAYFQNYDVYIEPTARVTFPQAHIFDIEQQFSNINKSMVEHPTTDQIAAVTQQTVALCKAITDDSAIMQQKNIQIPNYKVN